MTPLESRLAALAVAGETITYGALAREFGLRVVELTTALEALMEADARDSRPFRASVMNARGTDLPARGFFDKAAELGTGIDDRAAWIADQRLRLASKT